MSRIFTKLDNTPAETFRGIAIFLVASTIIPLLDACSKLLVTEHAMSSGTVAMMRLSFQTVSLLPVLIYRHGLDGLRTSSPVLNLVRGACLGFAGLFFFGALAFLPLADATAIFFVEPMILTFFAAVLLGETVGWRRISAVLVGFAGALIVIRPSFSAFGVVALFPVVAATLLAFYLILSRQVSRTTHALTMQVYAGVGGVATLLVAMTLAAPFDLGPLKPTWPPDGTAWFLILVAGAIGTIGHLMYVEAYKRAPGSVLAPFGYIEIAVAVILGMVLFGDFPDAVKWIGIAIIVGSGVFIYLRERQLSRRDRQPVVTP